MLRSTLITIMALGAAFLSFGCGGGDESESRQYSMVMIFRIQS